MKVLLITEKCGPRNKERDGGAMLVETIKQAFGDALYIMQFGQSANTSATWHFKYPFELSNRFERRLANANFIAEHVKAVEQDFTHVIFIHVSMQFGLIHLPLRSDIHIWTCPMFLSPSYIASGEVISERYLNLERQTLTNAKNILTPSHLEKRQLIEFYAVPAGRIHVVPRGINRKMLAPTVRVLNGPPKFCSIASIKSQKNTLGLIRLFANIRAKFSGATLKIIGPVQDESYYKEVLTEIRLYKLDDVVKCLGYIPANKIALAIDDAHIHISASKYETFGRSIFETLAAGLPNIARATGNAAFEFLGQLPYVKFIDNDEKMIPAIEEILSNFSLLSSMALEIGTLYDDEILCRMFAATICNKHNVGISDFDGTLFHKNDPDKTRRCVDAFRMFPKRVICSARPVSYLLEKLQYYHLDVDWIVGCSGAVVTDGQGNILWLSPLKTEDIDWLENAMVNTRRIEIDNVVLQIAIPLELLSKTFGLRVEVYQETAFIMDWQASKLRAVHRLLRYIDWAGQVRVFGDGFYDTELLTYFDGIFITSSVLEHDNQQKEIEYV